MLFRSADGSSKNGLYTENLVREFSVRGTRIEDAFKRVRLNVRLASRGTQIPWETTSLESDVFLFNDAPPKVSEAELEKQIEADIAQWTRIKSSRNVDDWVSYLRNFPNGRFAEIAQVRLTRLLADAGKPIAAGESTTASTQAKPTLAASSEAGVPTVRSEAEYDALPKGVTYIDPKGNVRRKS